MRRTKRRKAPLNLYLRIETIEELSRLAEEEGFDSISALVEHLVEEHKKRKREGGRCSDARTAR